MNLGARLKQARLELGLSQRQLCGEKITRNMLSQIENGSACPSVDTLRYLAAQLGKPMGYFLEEEAVTSPNQAVMQNARAAFARQDFGRVPEILADFRGPDPVFEDEKELLRGMALLESARQVLAQGRVPYCLELLERTQSVTSIYWGKALDAQRQLLLAQAGNPGKLPSLDEALLARAELALKEKEYDRCAALLAAVQDQRSARWLFLRGQVHLAKGNFADAADCFHGAEDTFPAQTALFLERCYRELEDYKQAYFYACRQREQQ